MVSRRAHVLAAVVALLLVAAPTPVGAAGHVETLASFDAMAGEMPEGVAVDKVGNIYVSIAPLGQLWKFEPGSSTPSLFGSVPVDPASGFGLIGLAVDARGNVYAGVNSPGSATTGVWRFDRKTGDATMLPGTEAIGIPNSLAFDKRGNLYVTDTFAGLSDSGEALGGVWKIGRDGSLTPWFVSELIGGTGANPVGLPLGANGIAYRHGSIYVAVTDRGSIVEIPVLKDGTAGTPTIVVEDPALAPADGIALDVHGRIYVAVVGQSTVVRVNTDGSLDTIATAADGLDFTSSLAFGTGKGQRRTLYAVNFALGPLFGLPPGAGPGLLAISVDAPGLPLP